MKNAAPESSPGATRSTPSAPRPRRRWQRARTAGGPSRPSGSGSSTKSFSVPWPSTNSMAITPPAPSLRTRRGLTRQGDDVVDERGRRRVEPPHPRVPAEPGALPAHEAAGRDDDPATGLGERIRVRLGAVLGAREHLEELPV